MSQYHIDCVLPFSSCCEVISSVLWNEGQQSAVVSVSAFNPFDKDILPKTC